MQLASKPTNCCGKHKTAGSEQFHCKDAQQQRRASSRHQQAPARRKRRFLKIHKANLECIEDCAARILHSKNNT
jgi:hypothetical protein